MATETATLVTVTHLERLRSSIRGLVIGPDDEGYDAARRIWNGAIDRHPACIARCTGVADVVAAVRFARERELEIAVRGGGHNVAGTAVCDDGVVIDLSAMRAVSVDTAGRTAWVQGGALWGDVDHETQAHGLATTGGIIGHTGVAGLTLGGGIGFLMRKHGLTVDNRVAAEVVTADGGIVRASADEHPDLFWALRGGGGNFGVVTAFRFALHRLGPTVMAGPVARVPHDATAYAARDVAHNIIIDAVWLADDSGEHAAAETAWARGFLQALQPHRAAGVYVNFLDSDDDASRVRAAYGDQTYRRLAEVKAKYDPDNAFHHNKNIQPG